MKIFEAPDYDNEVLTKFLESQIRREGVFKKRNLETLEKIRTVYRPFRQIFWKLESPTGLDQGTSESFIDEQLSQIISESDHRFLLWRPLYAKLRVLELDEIDVDVLKHENTAAVEQVVDDLIKHRSKGQELDDELRPKLRSLQADPLSAIALVVPRTPYGLRGEEKLLAERKEVHSFVLASSLVANCTPKDIMVAVAIGEQVYVRTIIGQYQDVSDGTLRTLVLETPGSNSLRDAQKAGRALTRISDLYSECIDLID